MFKNMAFLLLTATALFAADIKTEIVQVIVYPEMAMVQRQAAVRLQSGLNEVTIQNLPAILQDESVYARVEGAADVQLEDVVVEHWYLEKPEEGQVRKLADEIADLEKEDKLLETELKTLAAQETFLTSIQSTSSTEAGKQVALGKPATAAWSSSMSFIAENLNKIYAGKVGLEYKRKDLKTQMEVLKKQMSEMESAKPREEKSITLSLRAAKTGPVDVLISYLVEDVSWWPSYEVRALPQSGKVEVVYSGHIRQKSGEDWNQVDLILSTASPHRSAKAPEWRPWDVRLWEERPVSLRKADRNQIALAVQQAEEAGTLDMVVAPAPTRLESKSITAQFAVTGQRDVLSGEEPAKVLISRETFPAEMAYITIPRLSPFVYLQGKLTNSSAYPMLSGEALVYVDGDFVGRSAFTALAPGEKVDLSLGIDEGMKVKRELVKKYDSNAGVVSKKHEVEYDYRITLENYKAQAVRLTLVDQLPRSLQEEVKVEDVKLVPDASEWNKENQKLSWNVELKPKEKKEVTIHFKVSYPRDRQISGVD